MTEEKYSLDNIANVGTYYYTDGGALYMPRMLQATISDNKVIEHYSYSGTLKKPVEEIYKAFEDLGGRVLTRNSLKHPGVYGWENSYADVSYNKKSNSFSFSGSVTDHSLIDSFEKLAEEFLSKEKKNLIFSIVKNSSGSLKIQNLGKGSAPLIKENYNEQVIADYQYLIECFKKDPPVGRIAILSGEPGGGKTHLIRSFLSEIDAVFIIIPSNLIDNLDKPEFLPLLLDVKNEHEKAIILVIEDGDVCLVPRKNDNISTISSMLNLSDGILGALVDIKIVVSTNAYIKDMDQAIMRPGRLAKHIHVDALDYDRANKVYQRLMQSETASLPPAKFYTLAEIYDLFNNKDNINNSTVISSVGKTKTIGFSASKEATDFTLNKSDNSIGFK